MRSMWTRRMSCVVACSGKGLAVLSLAWAAAASAGDAALGQASHVHFMPNGVVLFTMNSQRTGGPACATIPNRFSVDGTTPAGKAQLSGLLFAISRGKDVRVIGTGGCTHWGDTESVLYFFVAD